MQANESESLNWMLPLGKEPPAIDMEALHRRMEESLRWAQAVFSFEEASSEAKSLVRDMRKYSRRTALPILASLLTVPDYQSNCIRLEILVVLALLHCTGSKKASLGTATRWYRGIGQTRCVLGEDPAEDVFVTLVHNSSGNYRMLEGISENAGFYTQRVADVVDHLPDENDFPLLKGLFSAALKISEAVCARAGLARYQKGSDEPKGQLLAAKLPRHQEMKKRVTFSSAEFEEMGITPQQVAVLMLPYDSEGELLGQSPGHSWLEFRPIVQTAPEEFVVALPTALTVCVRTLVIGFMHDKGLEPSFDRALAASYARTVNITPILGGQMGAPVFWREQEGVRYATFSQDIDEGVAINYHFFSPSIHEHHEGGFMSFIQDDGKIASELKKSAQRSIEEAEKRSEDFRFGLCVFVGCGWGKGYAIEMPDLDRENWMSEFIAASDLCRVSWLQDLRPEIFIKLRQAAQAASSAGVSMQNMNGVMNELAWARKNEGNIIPHESLTGEGGHSGGPLFLSIQQNALLNLRVECDQARDSHRITDHAGVWHEAQRLLITSEPNVDATEQLLYVSMDDVRTRRMSAVCELEPPIWICVEAPEFEEVGTTLRLWEMVRLWLPRLATGVFESFSIPENVPPVLINLRFGGSDAFQENAYIPTYDDLNELWRCDAETECSEFTIRFQPGFLDGFREPKNIAERTVVKALLTALLRHFSIDLGDSDIETAVNGVVKNDQARSFHAVHAHSFLQYVSDALPNDLLKLNKIDDATAKVGIGLNKLVPEHGGTIDGRKECTAFLEKVVDDLLAKIRAELSQFDRVYTLRRLYLNIEKVNFEEDRWQRTSAAILGLDDGAPIGVQRYIEESSKFAGASLTCRVLIEMGACMCPSSGGSRISNLEIEKLMAMTGLVVNFGGLSNAIHFSALAPSLSVSPFGGILFKNDFGEFVVEPVLQDMIERKFKDFAPSQQKNYTEPEFRESAKQGFDEEFWDVWTHEMGFDIDQGRVMVDQLEDFGIRRGEAVSLALRSEILDVLVPSVGDENVAKSFLDRFTLPLRSRWDKPTKDFAMSDIYPWSFGRRLSLVARPIVRIDDNNDPTFLISPNTIRMGFMNLISGAMTGRLDQSHFRTTRMRNEWWGKAKQELGRKFEATVERTLQEAGWQCRMEVELPHVLGRKVEPYKGAIDAIAWRDGSSDIYVIECKDLSPARNYSEVAQLLSKYQGKSDDDGEPDDLKRHLDRFALLEKERGAVGRFCRVENPRLVSALVCRGAVPMQYAKINALDGSFVGGIDELIRRSNQA